jgi:hypothetical protein
MRSKTGPFISLPLSTQYFTLRTFGRNGTNLG